MKTIEELKTNLEAAKEELRKAEQEFTEQMGNLRKELWDNIVEALIKYKEEIGEDITVTIPPNNYGDESFYLDIERDLSMPGQMWFI